MWITIYFFLTGFALSANGSPRTDNETQRVSDTASPDELNETLDSESQKSAIVTSAPVAEGCEFPPEMSGLWRSTLWGNVQISNNTIRLNRVLDGRSGLTSLTCFLTSDAGDYILRTETIKNDFDEDSSLYTCIRLKRYNADQFHVFVRTDRNGETNEEALLELPYNILQKGKDLSKVVCNSAKETKGVLIKKGRELPGALGCPTNLRGAFDIEYTNDLGKDGCRKDGMLTACTKNKTLVHTYTCSNTSESDEYICVEGTSDRILLYEKNAFPPTFSCLKLEKKDKRQVGSYRRISCYDSWWPPVKQNNNLEKFALKIREKCPTQSLGNGSATENSTVESLIVYNATRNATTVWMEEGVTHNVTTPQNEVYYNTTSSSVEIVGDNHTDATNSACRRLGPENYTVIYVSSTIVSTFVVTVLALVTSNCCGLN